VVDANIDQNVQVIVQQAQESQIGQQLSNLLGQGAQTILSMLGKNFDSVTTASARNITALVVFVISVVIVYILLSNFMGIKGKVGFALAILISLLIAGFWIASIGQG